MVNTTLVYIEKNNSYLMLHRVKKENDCNKDKWIGIGGKFEEGESPYDCAKREVKEETGLELEELEYRGVVTFVAREGEKTYYELMHLFWSNKFSGIEKKSSECAEGDLCWVPIKELNQLPHWQGDEIFLDLIQKKVPFFSLKLIYEDGKLIEYLLDK